MLRNVFICDAIRTPFARYGGALAQLRTDDLGALPLHQLMTKNPSLDWSAIDDVIYGCANQAGEDNRNVARMSLLLAGLPHSISGLTVNRLCASGLDAVIQAARAISADDAHLLLAGGVESMTRAPFVMAKTGTPFSRECTVEDTTIGWRFVNPRMASQYGIDSMPETAENVAEAFRITREDQDLFAFRSQQRFIKAKHAGYFEDELFPISIPQKRDAPILFDTDEHPRPDTKLESLGKLKPIVKSGGTVTAGNASGVNDGACALLLASEQAVVDHDLKPLARVVATATAGVEPRTMGIGPVPAVKKILEKTGLTISQIDLIELNEAFASQALACLRELGLPDDAENVNRYGGAIAIGHPLGASGARLVTTATHQLVRTKARYALCTMCVGVGQGVALLLESI